jgi:hypothetical protein
MAGQESGVDVGVDYTHAMTACKKRTMIDRNLKFIDNMIKKTISLSVKKKRRETYDLDKAREND